MIKKFLFFLFVLVLTLVWRFPYERAIADRISWLEQSTGTRVDYTPVSASIFGVEWRDVKVTTRGGVQANFTQAKLRPNWSGLSGYLQQGKGQARIVLSRQRQLEIRMDRLEVQSGSEKIGLVRATGDLKHELTGRKGEGSLRLELPTLKSPFPIADLSLETGSKLFWQDKGQGYELRAELNLVGAGASDFHADGDLNLEPQSRGLPHKLSGSFPFRTALGEGTLRLSGTWKNPSWTVVPKK